MKVTAVILSLAPIIWETGIGSDVMKSIAAPIVGGTVTLDDSRADPGARLFLPHETTCSPKGELDRGLDQLDV